MAKTSMYAIDRSEEYLAHYGIKGMKWGVRKAIEAGGTGLGNRKLARQYKKAQKKLAKLEKRANNGAKYARRAALLGAGAAAAGGAAALGTGGAAHLIDVGTKGAKTAGLALSKSKIKPLQKLGANMYLAGRKGERAGISEAVDSWGRSSTIGKSAANAIGKAHEYRIPYQRGHHYANGDSLKAFKEAGGAVYEHGKHYAFGDSKRNWNTEMARRTEKLNNVQNKVGGVTNNQIARAGAAALGLGLAGAAGYNAYRAATTKRAARKAAEFRNEMNKTFAGTAYGKQGGSSSGNKKRRRR